MSLYRAKHYFYRHANEMKKWHEEIFFPVQSHYEQSSGNFKKTKIDVCIMYIVFGLEVVLINL